MIKNYNLFLLQEGITLSANDIIDILKSLESKDNKNEKLINRLINTKDNNSKTVLMSIVQSNDENLVDYILQFDVDINEETKSGENVLFFCKNIKMFYKFYNLGVNIKTKNKLGKNILAYLASKKIFNVELYQDLINKGININEVDKNGNGILAYCLSNFNITKLLIDNNINLNDPKTQNNILHTLLYNFNHKNKIKIIKTLKLLFDNGLKVIDNEKFSDNIFNVTYWYNNNDEFIDKLLFIFKHIIKYLSDDLISTIFFKLVRFKSFTHEEFEKMIFGIFDLSLFPGFYKTIKNYFKGSSIYSKFNDTLKQKYPELEDIEKYNL